MFFGQIEKELFCGEIWSIWQNNKLPDHLQLLVDQELGKRDIWELQTQEPDNQPIHPSLRDFQEINYPNKRTAETQRTQREEK